MFYKFLFILSLSLVFQNTVEARCHGGYANHILEARFTGCNSKFLDELTRSGDVAGAVSNVCMGGCYSAMFNQALKPECDRKYTEALKAHERKIIEVAARNNCKDSGDFNTSVVSNSPDANCKWISRHTVDLTCGGQRNTNICGAGGRTICTGEVVCARAFKAQGTEVPAGAYNLSCLSKSGKCADTSLADCMNDIHTKPYEKELYYDSTVKSAVERARSVQ